MLIEYMDLIYNHKEHVLNALLDIASILVI